MKTRDDRITKAANILPLLNVSNIRVRLGPCYYAEGLVASSFMYNLLTGQISCLHTMSGIFSRARVHQACALVKGRPLGWREKVMKRRKRAKTKLTHEAVSA